MLRRVNNLFLASRYVNNTMEEKTSEMKTSKTRRFLKKEFNLINEKYTVNGKNPYMGKKK